MLMIATGSGEASFSSAGVLNLGKERNGMKAKWVVKCRVPGAEGSKTSSESFLVEADTPTKACDVVNVHLASDDFVGGEVADITSVRESTLISLVPYSKRKQ